MIETKPSDPIVCTLCGKRWSKPEDVPVIKVCDDDGCYYQHACDHCKTDIYLTPVPQPKI